MCAVVWSYVLWSVHAALISCQLSFRRGVQQLAHAGCAFTLCALSDLRHSTICTWEASASLAFQGRAVKDCMGTLLISLLEHAAQRCHLLWAVKQLDCK